MAITSMLFLFFFLPLSLAIYYLVGDSKKEYVLLVISLLFYSMGSLRYLTLFLVAIFLTVTIGRSLAQVEKEAGRKILLLLGVALNLGLLGYYKYADMAISTYNGMFGKDAQLKNLLLPLGISFFTFKAISYLADIYKHRVVLQESPAHDALYLSFFAQIQSGPLTRYQDMNREGLSCTREARKNLFADGVFRFLIGFNKKVLLANVLANITNEVFAAPFENFSVSFAWLGSICYSLQLFFDFAGYSDMAIGITEMFGYQCGENFQYPYMTESVSKFWRRWHISLSQWFRDYVYIPLGGSRSEHRGRVYFNLFVVWLLTGIWHGASWNFVVWGLGYFVLIAFERMTKLPERFSTTFGKSIYRVFTLLFINFQWVIFRSDNLRNGLIFIKKMFICERNPLVDYRTRFLIKDYFGFILFAILLCFPIVPWVGQKLENRKYAKLVYEVLLAVLVCALFLWAVSFVVAGQNNPFAYANF